MTPDERVILEEMDQLQEEWIVAAARNEAEAKEEDLQGRVSGTQEWKAARGEDGQKSAKE